MKELILKWLGINTIIKSEVEIALTTVQLTTEAKLAIGFKAVVPTPESLRKLVGNAIADTFRGMSDKEYEEYWYIPPQNNTFEFAIRKKIVEIKTQDLKNFINTEAFIDTVIERINSKQIK